MGIQNIDNSLRYYVAIDLTIPHGDSKRLPEGRPGRTRTWAHYPPWGFKTAGAPETGKYSTVSLSPMGIQNIDCPMPGGRIKGSLSPMGIQNFVGEGSSAGPARGLTIPHGDSKPKHRRVPQRYTQNSLSPMGIQNTNSATASSAVITKLTIPHGDSKRRGLRVHYLVLRTTHYPPWGFKTTANDVLPPPYLPISLSPMGIQNYRQRCLATSISTHLTIPHGDSKQQSLTRDRCRQRLTIPHGDSKLVGPNRRPHIPIAHYPPWGFKTRVEGDAQKPSRVSLSPMGIQNSSRNTRCAYDSSELTIPHGDSKQLEKHPLRIRLVRTHYPPWGFKTPRRWQSQYPMNQNSLSPMGIQNPPFLHLKNLPAPPEESTCPPNIYSYDPLFKHWSVGPGKPAPGTG